MKGCGSKIFKDKFSFVFDSLLKGCPFLLSIFPVTFERHTEQARALGPTNAGFTQKPPNWKKTRASWIIARLLLPSQASHLGAVHCSHLRWAELFTATRAAQQACRGAGARQWGTYATWKVCACDFLFIAAYLFGLAGKQVNGTQINEGWRRWGQTSRVSQQKQGVSHTVKPSGRLNGKSQGPIGALWAGAQGKRKHPGYSFVWFLLLWNCSFPKENFSESIPSICLCFIERKV